MTLISVENQITEAVEKLSESVVSINSMRLARDFRFGLVPVEGQGSGVIIDAKGYIITNHHVIDDAARVQAHLKDGRSMVGEVVGGDPSTDIAVVRVEADNLPVARLGDSEKLKVGQIALAVGNAFGLPGGPSVSAGVISALGRPLPGADFISEGLIQTDAAINPGNSGGPLADLGGNVVGINTAMIPFAQGVGFAVPINVAKWVSEQIIERGRVIRPWLGISGINVDSSLARRYGLQTDSGVLVVGLSSNSPAFEAGLRVGDVIKAIGNVKTKNMRDLLAALSKLPVGSEIMISLVRMGRLHHVRVKLALSPVQVTNIRPSE